MLSHPKILTINSYNSLPESKTTDDFLIKLPVWYDQYDTISIANCQIPKTYYGISADQNTFVITEDGTPRNITIDVGNYSFTSLATELKSQLGSGYTVNADVSTGKYTITHTTYTSTIYTFTSEKLAYTLGMLYPTTTFNALSYTTDIILYSTPCILLHGDIADDIQYSNTNNLYDSTLIAIPVSNVSDLSYITWVNPDVINLSYKNTKKDIIRFYITDIYNQSLNINDMPILITLMFYNRDNTNLLIREYYKFNINMI